MSGKLNMLLAALVVLCSLALVNAQYKARHLFIQLERLQQEARQLDIEWSQLQLDQSSLTKAERIEQIAREELNMVPVAPERTQYLTEGGQ
jgi:cell division protein FtsL